MASLAIDSIAFFSVDFGLLLLVFVCAIIEELNKINTNVFINFLSIYLNFDKDNRTIVLHNINTFNSAMFTIIKSMPYFCQKITTKQRKFLLQWMYLKN